MKTLREIKKYHEDCVVLCKQNKVEVLYTSGSNKMAIPHTVAVYVFRNFEFCKSDS